MSPLRIVILQTRISRVECFDTPDGKSLYSGVNHVGFCDNLETKKLCTSEANCFITKLQLVSYAFNELGKYLERCREHIHILKITTLKKTGVFVTNVGLMRFDPRSRTTEFNLETFCEKFQAAKICVMAKWFGNLENQTLLRRTYSSNFEAVAVKRGNCALVTFNIGEPGRRLREESQVLAAIGHVFGDSRRRPLDTTTSLNEKKNCQNLNSFR